MSEREQLLPKESVLRRIVQGFSLAYVMVGLAGTCFGLPSLKPYLLNQGLFMDHCKPIHNTIQCFETREALLANATSISVCVVLGETYIRFSSE
jgi:hypothetical protein